MKNNILTSGIFSTFYSFKPSLVATLTVIVLGGSPGLVIQGVDSHSKDRGFKSLCFILDGHFLH